MNQAIRQTLVKKAQKNAKPSRGFRSIDFKPGGRCWPPHPTFNNRDALIVANMPSSSASPEQWQSFRDSLEDSMDCLRVLAGLMSREELLAKWGMEEEVSSIPTEILIQERELVAQHVF